MFLRLTCYLDTVSLIRRQIQGFVVRSFYCREATAGVRNDDSKFVPPLELGAFPTHYGNMNGITPSDAPQEPVADQFWSTVTPVGIAGWTRVVIQRGLRVLSDVSLGRFTAITNGSINDVPGAALFRAAWLRLSGYRTSYDGTSRYRGFPDMNSSFISCPNNNEVTI